MVLDLVPKTAYTELLQDLLLGKAITREEACFLFQAQASDFTALLWVAGQLRDQGRGKYVSYSRKVFLPLTNICRDRCAYCTFRRDPDEAGAKTMTPEEVRQQARRARALGCKEALFSMGDKPELAFPQVKRALQDLGYPDSRSYLHAMCELVLEEGLLPHANPGLMDEAELLRLREVNVSMGLMLENISDRLLEKGQAHHACPDKVPQLRLRTIELAGKHRIPFTTGILIGIGETIAERVDSLFAIQKLHAQYGHIQEVIIQNFRTKPTIPMRDWPEPTLWDHLRTIAISRLILGPDMNIQAPPNLNQDAYPLLLLAGINDWGGISPLTRDFINPEAPWPHISRLRDHTHTAGFVLKERLAIYPEYIRRQGFLAASLRPRVEAMIDAEGYARQE
ncbi:MAG: 7,8-didemethyl-8-hydroxy-5-deazariboflavin synthase subunit CofG [Nitrospinota bacterium]|nr:MAG: 7,8-didemethyl-8-hydroxy-5-deazariboflavin synthase subunit CofG [Nitrospinota bacterium]